MPRYRSGTQRAPRYSAGKVRDEVRLLTRSRRVILLGGAFAAALLALLLSWTG